MTPLALLILATSLIAVAEPQVLVYYNGTVVVFPNGVTEFKLVGENVTPIIVQGSAFRLVNDTLFFSPNASRIVYVASISSGVVQIQEPYNVTAFLVLPFNYSLVYANPPPSAVFSQGNFYEVLLRGSNIYAVLSSASRVSVSSQASGQSGGPGALVDLLALGLVVSNSVLAWALVSLYRSRRTQVKAEQGVEVEVDTGLADRDRAIIEAVKKGANTLSEIVRATGLPKTTVYRRVKRLVKEGYLVERREGGKVWYEVADGKSEGD